MKNKKQIFLIAALAILCFILFKPNSKKSEIINDSKDKNKEENITEEREPVLNTNANKSKIEQNISILSDEIHSVKSKEFSWIKRTAYFNTQMNNVTKEDVESYLYNKLDSLTLVEPGVLIWLYPTIEHAEEKGRKWIAMIDCQAYKKPVLKFEEKIFNEFTNPENDTIDNIPKQLRKDIYSAIFYIEDEALKRAEEKFTDPNDWEKRWEEERKKLAKFKKKLIKYYNIDSSIYGRIMTEGIKKGWLEQSEITFTIK